MTNLRKNSDEKQQIAVNKVTSDYYFKQSSNSIGSYF